MLSGVVHRPPIGLRDRSARGVEAPHDAVPGLLANSGQGQVENMLRRRRIPTDKCELNYVAIATRRLPDEKPEPGKQL